MLDRGTPLWYCVAVETEFPAGFEWDPEKARRNALPPSYGAGCHGIEFPDAIRIFDDPWYVEQEEPDSIRRHGEMRWITCGRVDDRLLVVWTERGDNQRVISARKAERYEERSHEQAYRKGTGRD